MIQHRADGENGFLQGFFKFANKIINALVSALKPRLTVIISVIFRIDLQPSSQRKKWFRRHMPTNCYSILNIKCYFG